MKIDYHFLQNRHLSGGVYRTLEKVQFDDGPMLRAGKLVKVEAQWWTGGTFWLDVWPKFSTDTTLVSCQKNRYPLVMAKVHTLRIRMCQKETQHDEVGWIAFVCHSNWPRLVGAISFLIAPGHPSFCFEHRSGSTTAAFAFESGVWYFGSLVKWNCTELRSEEHMPKKFQICFPVTIYFVVSVIQKQLVQT